MYTIKLNKDLNQYTTPEKEQLARPHNKKFLERMNYSVEIVDSIEYDAILSGSIKDEWKTLFNVYPQYYFEVLQCANPDHCRECQGRWSKESMVGVFHPSTYSTADTVRLFHYHYQENNRILTLVQVSMVERIPATRWLWTSRCINCISRIYTPEGRHNTIGYAIPFDALKIMSWFGGPWIVK